jgi:hypothetical protein
MSLFCFSPTELGFLSLATKVTLTDIIWGDSKEGSDQIPTVTCPSQAQPSTEEPPSLAPTLEDELTPRSYSSIPLPLGVGVSGNPAVS